MARHAILLQRRYMLNDGEE